jgi:hypothetical protein
MKELITVFEGPRGGEKGRRNRGKDSQRPCAIWEKERRVYVKAISKDFTKDEKNVSRMGVYCNAETWSIETSEDRETRFSERSGKLI